MIKMTGSESYQTPPTYRMRAGMMGQGDRVLWLTLEVPYSGGVVTELTGEFERGQDHAREFSGEMRLSINDNLVYHLKPDGILQIAMPEDDLGAYRTSIGEFPEYDIVLPVPFGIRRGGRVRVKGVKGFESVPGNLVRFAMGHLEKLD